MKSQTPKALKPRIMEVMATVFEVPVTKISDNSSADTIESWDSLKHMNLVIALEEEFKVSIPDEDVGNLTSFKLIEVVLKELGVS